ncbi:Leucinostatins biosynthesis cluster protein T [Pseudocercospora fuligena]|uniref:Leucinostatins biosynthesis cluster protein T n=1 Tax=Pseudocercospora fuligena TaxID=685502 RepID=A0A8H6RMV0_9PEZI|nr:Leucinostatins biosynthesis cluster protein T [Pseudocercospora fuligena]
MAHIILTGATGTAGAGILSYALTSPAISKISILSRRAVKLANDQPKAQVIIHNDFKVYSPEVLAQLKDAKACIWAQGKSSMGMSEQDYTELTLDYPLAAAKAFAGLGPQFNFVYMSGEGANAEKETGQLFARVKGRAERELLKLQEQEPSLRVYNIRPGGIHPEGNYLAERTPTMTDKGIRWLGAAFEKVYKSVVISTDSLAKASVKLAIGNGEPIPPGKGIEYDGRLIKNTALRRLAETG